MCGRRITERTRHRRRRRRGDGNTLFLRVRATGGRHWLQNVRIDGRRTERGLGGYPVVILEEARATAMANRRMLRQGVNPFEERAKAELKATTPTFTEALKAVLAIQSESWKGPKSEAQWRASMRDYALPVIGKSAVDAIDTPAILQVLTPIWNDKRETASRVKQRMSAVFKWAVAKGYRKDNPVDAVDAVLPKTRVAKEHHRALPWADVPAAMEAVRNSEAHKSTKLAFKFLVLTAARSGEVRGATWAEFDNYDTTWVVPAERMKAKAEHVVPLSKQAQDVLAKAAKRNGDGLVFASQTGKELSDNHISKLLRDNGIDGVPHGFRSSFRDWAAEHGYDRTIAEAALAHVVGGVEGAYYRTKHVEKRRKMMQAWADHCLPRKG